jgi:hypothetical protein
MAWNNKSGAWSVLVISHKRRQEIIPFVAFNPSQLFIAMFGVDHTISANESFT